MKLFDFGAIVIAIMGTLLAIDAIQRYKENQDEKKVHYVCVEHYDADTGEKINECNIK